MPVVSVVLYTGENWTGEAQMTTIWGVLVKKGRKNIFRAKIGLGQVCMHGDQNYSLHGAEWRSTGTPKLRYHTQMCSHQVITLQHVERKVSNWLTIENLFPDWSIRSDDIICYAECFWEFLYYAIFPSLTRSPHIMKRSNSVWERWHAVQCTPCSSGSVARVTVHRCCSWKL